MLCFCPLTQKFCQIWSSHDGYAACARDAHASSALGPNSVACVDCLKLVEEEQSRRTANLALSRASLALSELIAYTPSNDRLIYQHCNTCCVHWQIHIYIYIYIYISGTFHSPLQ